MRQDTLINALDKERIRQGLTRNDLSYQCGGHDIWSAAVLRGSTTLKTFLRVCDKLDVEIVLVNKEGINIF